MKRVLALLMILMLMVGVVAAQDDLSETYQSPDRSFSFQHPAGWEVVQDLGAYLITNGEYSSDFDLGSAMPEGQFMVIIIPATALNDLGFDASVAPQELIDTFAMMLSFEGDMEAEVAESVERTVAGMPSLRSLTETGQGDVMLETVEMDAGLTLVIGVGSLMEHLDSIDAMLDSISMTEPEPVDMSSLQTFTTGNVSSLTLLQDLGDTGSEYYSVALNEDGSRVVLVVSGDPDRIEVRNTLDQSVVFAIPEADFTFATEDDGFDVVDYLHDGNIMALTYYGSVYVLDGESGEVLNEVQAPEMGGALLLPDGNTLAQVIFSEENLTFSFVDMASGEATFTYETTQDLGYADFSKNGNYMAIVWGNDLYVTDVGNPGFENAVATLTGEDFYIESMAVSDDGSAVAISSDYQLMVYDVASGEQRFQLDRSEAPNEPANLIFTPDGSMLIASERNAIIFWDAMTGEMLHRVSQNVDGTMEQMDISGDGSVLASVAYDTGLLWGVPGE